MTIRHRKVHFHTAPVTFDERPDGTLYVTADEPLAPYPERLTARLVHWAEVAPERTFIAQRDADDNWRRVSYAETLDAVRALGQALLDRGLSAERPLLVVSGNDIEHALLGLAALHVGIPYAPVSPAYSLASRDFAKLRHIHDLLTPGLVFAASGQVFGKALAAVVADGTEIAVAGSPGELPASTPFTALLGTVPSRAVDAAYREVAPETIGKFLFTSGSTGLPKGVINTQRMLCSNQVMLNTSLAFLKDAPPVIVDWLPWNHTFGGNHNVGLVLFNGGTLYIDDGLPTPAGIAKTVRNLREIAPTVYFNVPKGYDALVHYLRAEPELRKTFFSQVQMLFFAGAGMAQPVWDALDALAVDTCGEAIVVMTGLGATESAPFALCCTAGNAFSGAVGLPVPGVELKLVPSEDKLEARLRGPSITPGFWRQPEATAAAFDAEGFYCLGDALRLIDPGDLQRGFLFDGRITEDFKLATGTWVSVGPLRARFIEHGVPYVQDVVIVGLNRNDVTVLVFPDAAACRTLAPGLADDAPLSVLVSHPAVVARFAALLDVLATQATGSSTRIMRAILLDTPPAIDTHEMTDKGSINQRAVLANRADLVELLYREPYDPRVITAGSLA